MNNCIFCQIINKKIPSDIVYENKNILIMLDIDYSIKGHTLVIWKKHYVNASDLSEEDFLKLSKMIHHSEKLLLKILNKDKSILLVSAVLVSHFHFHIYPVISSIKWPEIRDMFGKQIKYKYKTGEKEKLVNDLHNGLISIR